MTALARLWGGVLAMLLLAPPPAHAQAPADTLGVTVPVPDRGVLYYRAGPVGPSRVRLGRAGPPPQAVTPPSRSLDALIAEELAAAGRAGPGALSQPITRLDLLRMELGLRRALDDRLNRLLALQGTGGGAFFGDGGGRRPVIVVPGATALTLPGTPPPDAPLTPPPPPPSLGVTPPLPTAIERQPRAPLPSPGEVAVREVERALLDTGLFRAVGVNFEFDRAALLPSALQTLDLVGEVLERYPDLRVAVHGHTDSVGSAAYNLGLSARRAEAVRDYLLRAFPGVGAEQIEAEGFGLTRPIATNANPTGRALNRRVEFVVLEAPEPVPAEEAARGESFEDRVRRIIREEQEAAGGEDG